MVRKTNEENRFGSAAWATGREIQKAGLFDPRGPQVGHWEGRALHVDGDAPMITIGGAGSGKLTCVLAYNVCRSPGQRMLIIDPRGEMAAISDHVHAPCGDYKFTWNPTGLCRQPHNRCNPLDILKLDSPTFHTDCTLIMESLVAIREGKNDFFDKRAREVLESFVKSRVEQNGKTSLSDLYRAVNTIQLGGPDWADWASAMLRSQFDDVQRNAADMLDKQKDAPKEFSGIMGSIYNALSFLTDPVLLDSLSESDFSLSVLCDPLQPAKVFLIVPADYLGIWSPLLRLFFEVTTRYKSRAPHAPRIILLVDEAGQLGKFDALKRAFTFGRGMGVRAWAIFQDTGQIVQNFGESALQTFLGSAQTRQFFGVRDYTTALLVSNMLGAETLEYDDKMQQDTARRYRWQVMQRVLAGSDPIKAAYDIEHYTQASRNRSKQHRLLMTPSEILALPEDRQILFVSGKNRNPILAQKFPYFSRSEMSGYYLANDWHPPIDSVVVTTHRGPRRLPIVTERVPQKYASFPQHSSGFWSYVQGYKPL